MNLKEKFAQKMLDEKLDFLPLQESLELFDSGEKIKTRFWWVMRNEELYDNGDGMSNEELMTACEEIYGLTDYALRVGKEYEEFDEFTLNLCPAPTYIDLIK